MKSRLKNVSLQQYYKSKKLQKIYSPFSDSDKDGFINISDCYPFDSNRHGVWSWVKSIFVPAPAPQPTVTATPIAPTTTAVRSVDIVKTGGGGGGAVTIKGKTAWRGGGGSPVGQPPTEVQVTGVNVPPEQILTFAESKGIVDRTTPPSTLLPAVQEKPWLQDKAVKVITAPAKSTITKFPTMVSTSRIKRGFSPMMYFVKRSAEAERKKEQKLIDKYKEGKKLSSWEISKLMTMGYIKDTKFSNIPFGLQPIREDDKRFQVTKSLIIKPAEYLTKKDIPQGVEEVVDFYVKMGMFGGFMKTAGSKQKLVNKGKQKPKIETKKKQLELIKKQVKEVEWNVVYDKRKAREFYSLTVKKFGKGSKEVKAVEKLYKNVIPKREAEMLMKDALEQEGLITERSIFSGGVKSKGTDLIGYKQTAWASPKTPLKAVVEVDKSEVFTGVSKLPKIENIEEIGMGSKALEDVFNLFKLQPKVKPESKSKIKQSGLMGGMVISKVRLDSKQETKQKSGTDTALRYLTGMGTTTITRPKTTTIPTQPSPPIPTYTTPTYTPQKYPAPAPPIISIFNLGGRGRVRRPRKQVDYFKRLRKAYQPSVGAVVLGIKAKKKPFKLTGLELRPMIIPKRKSIKRKETNYLKNVNKIFK